MQSVLGVPAEVPLVDPETAIFFTTLFLVCTTFTIGVFSLR